MAGAAVGPAGGEPSHCERQPTATWYIRRLLYGYISRGGVRVVPCAQGCSFCTYVCPADHAYVCPADHAFVEVRLVNTLNGNEVFRDRAWAFSLAGDIISKANWKEWDRSTRSWEYTLVNRSVSRTPIGELRPLGKDVLTLSVIKKPFDATNADDNVQAVAHPYGCGDSHTWR